MKRLALLALLCGCESWQDLADHATCTDCAGGAGGAGGSGGAPTAGGSTAGGGASAGGANAGGASAGGATAGGGAAGGATAGGATAGGATGGGSSGVALPCSYTATLISCQLANGSARIAAGHYDGDGKADLALYQPATSGGIARGVHWLRNRGDAGFDVIPVMTTPSGPVRLMTLSTPMGPATGLAVLHGSTLYAWPPGSTSAPVLAATGVTDATRARMPWWANDGLAALTSNGIDLYPNVTLGDGDGGALANTPSQGWARIEAWRDWLMLSDGANDGHIVVPFADGGRFQSVQLVAYKWTAAQEVDLLEDTSTEFFMHIPNIPAVHGVAEQDAGRPTGSTLPQRHDLAKSDGGTVPPGAAFVVGPWGPGGDKATLFTFPTTGGARLWSSFVLGGFPAAAEVPRAELNLAGVQFMQGLLVDVTGDGSNDLVVVDANGLLRIYPFQ